MTAPASPFVCLVTPGHVASTPRLVKEADALADAGYRVHVVAGRHFAPADPLDAEILAAAKWTHTRVDYRGGPGCAARKLLRRVARRLMATAPLATPAMAACAHHAEIRRFARTAAAVGADFYFAHCLGGLPAAAQAAGARNVPYGFDAEDFHDAETTEAINDRTERTIRRTLHVRHLPGCAFMTAASPLIGRRYAEVYGVPAPETVLNVFPLSHAPVAPADPGPITEERPARCYWFSQTIGPGRGLEAVITILARLRTPVELHLRGHVDAGYKARLQGNAYGEGLRRAIVFHSPGPPAEMARLAAPFDLGISSEEPPPLNRDLCLTNKVFVYLLAGIPQFLSRTRAQAALAPELGAAALLGDLERVNESAGMLDAFFAAPSQVAAARSAAWELGRGRFNWDREKERFLRAVREVAGAPSP